MDSIEEIRWRNASYGGVVEFRVKVTKTLRERDLNKAEVEKIAKAIRSTVEGFGRDVRVEHQRYPG